MVVLLGRAPTRGGLAGFADDFCGYHRSPAVVVSSDNHGRFVLTNLSAYRLAVLGEGGPFLL
jgi:hypothetical protein